MLDALLVAGLQFLEPVPELAEPGTAVQVRAVDRDGQPVVGLPVEVLMPDGQVQDLGTTDADGTVVFEAADVGEHVLRAQMPAPTGPVRLWTPYHVVAPPRRWLYALGCVPLGLALLWVNLRRLRGKQPVQRE